MEQNSEIIIYTAPDGTTKLQVQLEDETVWLTQDQMAMLFGKAKSTINEHIKNIYAERRAGREPNFEEIRNFRISAESAWSWMAALNRIKTGSGGSEKWKAGYLQTRTIPITVKKKKY